MVIPRDRPGPRRGADSAGRRGLLALAGLAAAGRAGAQPAWVPPRQIRLVVPSVAGSTPDLFCRLVAEGMRPALGPIVVENRPGGLGTIGLSEVARAAPDGTTLGYVNVVSMAINNALLASQPYVIERDFAPVALLGFVQNAILVRPTLPVATLSALVEAMRAAPGQLSYGSPGIGTTGHLAMELLCALTGTEALHVPYRGSPQLQEALLRGEVDIACDNLSSVQGTLRAGDARGIAVTGPARTPLFPDLPTAGELGWPEIRITSWGGLVVPAGTPAAAVARLNAAANAALVAPALAPRFAELAFEAVQEPPQALFDLAARERPVWAELVRRSGAAID